MSEPYVPSEKQVREWCAEGSGEYRDIMNAWLDRFLARIRRDAAREALDGLAKQFEAMGDGADQADAWAWEWHAQEDVEEYRDRHYPKQEGDR